MPNKTFFVSLLIICIVEKVAARKKFRAVLFRNIETNYNTDYVGNYTVVINADQESIDLELRFLKDLTYDVGVQMSISQKLPKMINYRDIFTYDVNVCSILGKKDGQTLNIIYLWMNNLMKYSNMPRHCPVKEGIYNWRNLHPEKNSIPVFVQSGNYRLDARFYLQENNNALLTNTSIWVDIKMK